MNIGTVTTRRKEVERLPDCRQAGITADLGTHSFVCRIYSEKGAMVFGRVWTIAGRIHLGGIPLKDVLWRIGHLYSAWADVSEGVHLLAGSETFMVGVHFGYIAKFIKYN